MKKEDGKGYWETKEYIENVTFENIEITGGILVVGLKDLPNLRMNNSTIEFFYIDDFTTGYFSIINTRIRSFWIANSMTDTFWINNSTIWNFRIEKSTIKDKIIILGISKLFGLYPKIQFFS